MQIIIAFIVRNDFTLSVARYLVKMLSIPHNTSLLGVLCYLSLGVSCSVIYFQADVRFKPFPLSRFPAFPPLPVAPAFPVSLFGLRNDRGGVLIHYNFLLDDEGSRQNWTFRAIKWVQISLFEYFFLFRFHLIWYQAVRERCYTIMHIMESVIFFETKWTCGN